MRGVATRWPLADLRRAVLTRVGGPTLPDQRSLTLYFGAEPVRLASRSYAGLGRIADQCPAFASFCRALLAQAAEAAPDARYERQGGSRRVAVAWAAGGLAIGAAAVLAVGLLTRSASLGLDLCARLTFMALMAATPWPWIDGKVETFDPGAPPSDLL